MNIFTRTIHPAPNYNTQWTTAIHGLTYDYSSTSEKEQMKNTTTIISINNSRSV